MKFQITILGTGSSTPTLTRNPASQVVNVNENYYMIDCAEGTQLQLRRYKVKFQRINHIFISHLHGDHYLGLIGLMQSMHLLGRKNELHIYGHPDLHKIINLHNSVSETFLKFPVCFHELNYENKTLLHEDSKASIYSFPLRHRIPTCGFVFEEKPRELTITKEVIEAWNIPPAEIRKIKQGADFKTAEGRIIPNEKLTVKPVPSRKYAYCSDTNYFEKMIPDIQGADLLYHESTFLNDLKSRAKETFHSTAGQAAEIAKKSGAKKLLLGHFSARYKAMQDFEEEARAIFPETTLAQDGMVVDL